MMEFDPIHGIIAGSTPPSVFFTGWFCCLLRQLHPLSPQLLSFVTKNCIHSFFHLLIHCFFLFYGTDSVCKKIRQTHYNANCSMTLLLFFFTEQNNTTYIHYNTCAIVINLFQCLSDLPMSDSTYQVSSDVLIESPSIIPLFLIL